MAINDIFGQKSATFGDAFSSDDAFMSFPNVRGLSGENLGASTPLLLQSAGFNYAQQITRLFDLSSTRIYYVRGRAQGQGQLGQVLGPSKLSQAFLNTYGNVCNAGTNAIAFRMLSGCTAGTSGSAWSSSHGFTARYVVLDSIGFQMTAEQMVIQQNVSMMISSFEYDDQAA